jgi:hypothetical protein
MRYSLWHFLTATIAKNKIMNDLKNSKHLALRAVVFILLIITTFSCENHRFDSDKRQIMAKDEIRSKLNKARSFDVTGFNEDTVYNTADSNFKKLIRYQLSIKFIDSNKIEQNKTAVVLFAPDGKSILSSQILEK